MDKIRLRKVMETMSRIFLLVIISLLLDVVHGQTSTTIHKCQRADGSYVYSDQECGGGETFTITSKDPDTVSSPMFDPEGITMPPGSLPASAYTAPAVGSYDNYEVRVEDIASGFYRVISDDMIIHAPHCFELSLSDEAILSVRGSVGRLFFLDSGDSCDVETLFLPISQNGQYRLTVKREQRNIYLTRDSSVLVNTKLCHEFGFSEDVLLDLDAGRGGVLYFEDDQCDVVAVYERGEM